MKAYSCTVLVSQILVLANCSLATSNCFGQGHDIDRQPKQQLPGLAKHDQPCPTTR